MKLRLGIVARLTLVFVLFAAGLLAGVSLLVYNIGRAALEQATVSDLLSIATENRQPWVRGSMRSGLMLSRWLPTPRWQITCKATFPAPIPQNSWQSMTSWSSI